MVNVNQFFKPPNYFPGRISSKTGRKVVQKNCEVISTFHITLRACEIPRSVSKTVNNFFHYELHLRPKKKATRAAEMMSVELVAIFWVVNASSGEKSCLQFSMPTGSGAGGGGGVSHSLKAM